MGSYKVVGIYMDEIKESNMDFLIDQTLDKRDGKGWYTGIDTNFKHKEDANNEILSFGVNRMYKHYIKSMKEK